MARLILEEGGQRRAFRVNKGKLSIGSGEDCTLRLSSPDVAEVHAELEVGEEGIILRPRPGVMPPMLMGRPVTVPMKLPESGQFRIGSAVFHLQPEEQAASAAAPGAAAAAGRPRRPVRAGESKSRVQTSRPIHKIERGVPTWVVLGILAGIGGVALVIGRSWLGNAAKVEYDPYERLRVANENFNVAAFERAEVELTRIDLERAPELRPEVEKLRKRIAEVYAEAQLDGWNVEGTKVLDQYVRGYHKKYMQGDKVPRERARVFVKRCIEFREKWPKHPEIGWVDRYQRRFEPVARLDEPPTFTDVAYETKTLTWAKPRNYKKAFAILDEFMASAQGSDLDGALELQGKLNDERDEYFWDRMQQAKYFWQNDKPRSAVAELVHIIIWIGDADMADQAASELVVLPDIDQHLRGYQSNKADTFQSLMENETVRAVAQEKGVL